MTTRELARLATKIENRDPQALATLNALPPGNARIVGITGPPGAGKSTLVDALALALRAQNKTVAIIAVDPTSRLTGGAILGDRIRMQQHHADPGIFIRSMATRGTMGGLARATADLARLMSAAGRDYVLIETVGVGQDEMEIAGVAQVTIVVLVPGMGDDIQAIKAGIMEIADIFVINKSDQPGADRVERELHAAGFTCPVIRTVATTGEGIQAVLHEVGQASWPVHRPIPAPNHTSIAVLLGDTQSEPQETIVLRVPDLDAAIAALTAAGAQILNQNQVSVHRASTGGLLLELIQEHSS